MASAKAGDSSVVAHRIAELLRNHAHPDGSDDRRNDGDLNQEHLILPAGFPTLFAFGALEDAELGRPYRRGRPNRTFYRNELFTEQLSHYPPVSTQFSADTLNFSVFPDSPKPHWANFLNWSAEKGARL